MNVTRGQPQMYWCLWWIGVRKWYEIPCICHHANTRLIHKTNNRLTLIAVFCFRVDPPSLLWHHMKLKNHVYNTPDFFGRRAATANSPPPLLSAPYAYASKIYSTEEKLNNSFCLFFRYSRQQLTKTNMSNYRLHYYYYYIFINSHEFLSDWLISVGNVRLPN